MVETNEYQKGEESGRLEVFKDHDGFFFCKYIMVHTLNHKSLAEAVGKMYLYLKENNLL
jgi:hypothetical protein